VLPGLPKCLAPVQGRPFLKFQIDALMAQGVTRFVLALGHMAYQVEQAVEALRGPGIQIRCVVESAPLGTGGAILHSLRTLGLTEALVANGDTLLDGSLAEMLVPLDLSEGVLTRIATVSVPDRSRYGCVLMDTDCRVSGFLEKGHGGPGPINAGFYRVHADAFGSDPTLTAFSFETATLPMLAQRRALAACRIEATFIDIGVPSEYRRFCEEREAT
jgi:NDP-sugar pyrophosphorylase family protein